MAEWSLMIKKISNILTITLSIFLVLFFVKAAMDGHFETIETFQAFIRSYGIIAPFIFIFIQTIQVVIPIIPGVIGCTAGGALFGAWAGFAYNYIGICSGSFIAFFLARKYGIKLVRLLVSEKHYNKYMPWLTGKTLIILLWICILLPLAPDDALCYLAGLSTIKKRQFIPIILIGKIFLIAFYSFGIDALLHFL